VRISGATSLCFLLSSFCPLGKSSFAAATTYIAVFEPGVQIADVLDSTGETPRLVSVTKICIFGRGLPASILR